MKKEQNRPISKVPDQAFLTMSLRGRIRISKRRLKTSFLILLLKIMEWTFHSHRQGNKTKLRRKAAK